MKSASWRSRHWHGNDAVALDDGRIEVVVMPGQGGRIVSIRHVESGHEWLVRGHPGPLPNYGDPYVSPTMGGWDEMMPTIDACSYPVSGAHHGRAIPDHGEVWSRPWTVSIERDTLTMTTAGVALPYTLIRIIRSVRPGVLDVLYRLETRSPEPITFLWAAHPLFARGPGTMLVLPDDVTTVDLVNEASAGTTVSVRDSSVLATTAADPPQPVASKFYVPLEVPVSWVALDEPDLGVSLRLDWDRAITPYLGIWIDRGLYTPRRTIALEPTNGYYDDLSRASGNGRVGIVTRAAAVEWWLTVTVG